MSFAGFLAKCLIFQGKNYIIFLLCFNNNFSELERIESEDGFDT